MTRREPSNPDPTSRALQQAIRESGLSLREIARRADLDIGIVSRFVSGQRAVTVGTAHTIAKALGLRFKLVRRQGKGGKPGGRS